MQVRTSLQARLQMAKISLRRADRAKAVALCEAA